MRPVSPQEWAIATASRRTSHTRVLVEDATGVLQDLTGLRARDFVHSAKVDFDTETLVAQAVIQLRRRIDHVSLSPYVASSVANNGGPLLDDGRRCLVEMSVTPAGQPPTRWVTVFDGQIETHAPSQGGIQLVARDALAELQALWVEDQVVYGTEDGQALHLVMQDLLDDWAPGTTLRVPTAPTFLVKEYEQQPQPVQAALQGLADLIGWEVRMVWDDGSSSFRLTLREPPRGELGESFQGEFSPDAHFGIQDFTEDRASIRNVIRIRYGRGERTALELSDEASILQHRRRFMEIQESGTSMIDTAEEATALAQAALTDLAQPMASFAVEVPLNPYLELGDVLRFLPDGETLEELQDVSVTRLQHDSLSGRTRAVGRASVHAGAARRWLLREVRTGVLPRDEVGRSTPPTPSGLTLTPALVDVAVTTTAAVDASWVHLPFQGPVEYEVRWRVGDAEFSSARTTDSVYRIQPLVPGLMLEVQVRAVNPDGRASSWSTIESLLVPGDASPPGIPTVIRVDSAPGGFQVVLANPTERDFRRFRVHASSAPGFTPDDGTLVEVSASTTIPVGGMASEQQYAVRVQAEDFTGNRSGFTVEELVTTPAPSDTPVSFEDVSGELSQAQIDAAFAAYLDGKLNSDEVIAAINASGETIYINARRIIASNPTNHLVNGFFRDRQTGAALIAPWAPAAGEAALTTVSLTGDDWPSGHALLFRHAEAFSEWFEVEAGQPLSLVATVQRAGLSQAADATIGIQYRDKNGSPSSVAFGTSAMGTADVRHLQQQTHVPIGAIEARVRLWQNTTAASAAAADGYRVSNVLAQTAGDVRFFVPGTIEGRHIAGETITGENMVAKSITARELLLEGEDFGNLIRNPVLATGDLSGWPDAFDRVESNSSTSAPAPHQAILRTQWDLSAVWDYAVPVRSGHQLKIEVRFARKDAGSDAKIVEVGVFFEDAQGNIVDAGLLSRAAGFGAGWHVMEGIVTTPTSAVFARPVIRLVGADSAVVEVAFTAFSVQRVGGGLGPTTALTNEGMEVRDQVGEGMVWFGDVTGQPGVPSSGGPYYGMAGRFGTGIWLEGVPRVVAAGAASHADVLFGTAVVPAGKKWILIGVPYAGGGGLGTSMPSHVATYRLTWDGAPTAAGGRSSVLSAGTWTNVRLEMLSDTGYGFDFTYQVLEVDA